MLGLVTFVTLLHPLLGGMLTPDPESPVQVTSANARHSTSYTFSFVLQTAISQDASITVEFPSQFAALTSSSCTGFIYIKNVRTGVICSRVGNTVKWQVTALTPGDILIGFDDVMNPDASGGTGNFRIRTYQAAKPVDENEVFPAIAIYEQAKSFRTQTLSTEGSLAASYSPLYRFNVTVSELIPSESWLRLTFPQGFDLYSAELSCFMEGFNVSLACKAISRYIATEGLPMDLVASTLLAIRVVGPRNPPISGPTGSFQIEAMKPNSSIVLQTSSLLPGLFIQPGTLTGIQVQGGPLNHNVEVNYTVTYTTSNPIPQGGWTSVEFPIEFNGCTGSGTLNGILRGVSCGVNSNIAKCVTGEEFLGGLVQVWVTAKNPSTATESAYFTISTYTASGVLIDTNTRAARLTFSGIDSPASVSLDMFTIKSEVPIGSYGALQLYLQTRNSLPATSGAQVGRIVLTLPAGTQLPAGITIPVDARISCLFGKQKVPAATCTYNSALKQVTMDTPASGGLEGCPLAITITTIGNPTATDYGFKLDPALATGQQFFGVQIWINGSLKEEAVYKYIPAPKPITSAIGVPSAGSASLLPTHYTVSQPNPLILSLKPSIPIPVGGSIEVEFRTSNFGFPRDLGWGLLSYQTANYPCFYDNDSGAFTFSSTQITAGTWETPAYIRLLGLQSAIYSTGTVRNIYLPHVFNGPYADNVPELTIRTKLSTGEELEYQILAFPHPLQEELSHLTTSLSGLVTFVGTNTADDTSTSYQIQVNTALSANNALYLVFPLDYAWPNEPSNVAATGSFAGFTAYRFSHPALKALLVRATANISSPAVFTMALPTNFRFASASSFTLYAMVGLGTPVPGAVPGTQLNMVYLPSMITTPAPLPAAFSSVSISEQLFDTSKSLNYQRALYLFTFTSTVRMPAASSVSVLFPIGAGFTSIDSTCFELVAVPVGVSCTAENGIIYAGLSYSRYLLTGFGLGLSVNYTFRLRLFATTGAGAGTYQVTLLSSGTGNSTADLLNLSTVSITLATNAPINAAIAPTVQTSPLSYTSEFATPLVDLRAGEYGDLAFTLQLSTFVLARSSSAAFSLIEVVLPTIGYRELGSGTASPGTFQQAAGSFLECRFDQVLSSLCEVVGPASAPIIRAWVPNSIDLQVGISFTLTITALDATNSQQIGFLAPTSGYYRFVLRARTYNNVVLWTSTPSHPPSEQGEAWVFIPPTRFLQVSVQSANKSALEYTALFFQFVTVTALQQSSDPTAPGYVYLEFPTGAAAWAADLGSGLAAGNQIDCVNNPQTGDPPLVSAKCYLEAPYTDFLQKDNSGLTAAHTVSYARIKMTFTANVSAGSLFKFIITGIKNPPAGVDLLINIKSYTHQITNPAAPYWTLRDSSTANYIDTTLGLPLVSASPADTLTPTTWPNWVWTTSVAMTIQLTFSVAVPGSGKDYVLVSVDSSFQLPQSLVTCTLDGWPVGLCRSFPVINWVLLRLDSAKAIGNHSLVLSALGGANYRRLAVCMSYHIVDRKTVKVHPHSASPLSAGSCHWSRLKTTGTGVPGSYETYCLAFYCDHVIPKDGKVVVSFPPAYAGKIDAKTCRVGPNTGIADMNLACSNQVTLDYELHISGFQADVAGSTTLEIYVEVTNPMAAASYSDFSVITYYSSADQNSPIDEEIGSGWRSIVIQPNPAPDRMQEFKAGTMYHDRLPVRTGTADAKTGPLEFTIVNNIALTKQTSSITISSAKSVFVGTGRELRCLWQFGASKYLGSQCGIVSSVITMYTPTDFAFPAGSTLSIFITTVNYWTNQGLTWNAGAGLYTLDIVLDNTSVQEQQRLYVEILPELFPQVQVIPDHITAGVRNRLIFVVENASILVIPDCVSGGRLVVEFPVQIYGADLGGYSDNQKVSCMNFGTALQPLSPFTKIQCYFMKGQTGAQAENPKVVISGFDTITAGSTFEFHLDNIRNPATASDSTIVSVEVYAVDVSAGWPGTKLAHSYVYNIFSTQTSALSAIGSIAKPVPNSPADAVVMATGAKYIFTLPTPSSGNFDRGDLYYLVLDSRLYIDYIGSPSTTCSGGNVAECRYYPDSNTVIYLMNGSTGGFASIIAGFTNSRTLSTGLVTTGLVVQSQQATNSVSYTLSDVPFFTPAPIPVTIQRVDLKNMYRIDQEDWVVSFTNGISVPATGGAVLSLDGDGSFPESLCISYTQAGSTVAGTLSCTATGSTMTVALSVAQAAGTVFHMIVKVATGSTTTTLTLTMCQEIASPSAQEEGQVTINFSGSAGGVSHEIPLRLKFPNVCRYQTHCMLTFNINSPVSLAPSATITVKLPAGISVTTGYLVCLVNSVAVAVCQQTTTTVTMQSPPVSGLPTGPSVIQLTSVDGNNPNSPGMYINAGVGDYYASINFGSYTGTDVLRVLPNKKFSELYVSIGHTTAGQINFFKVVMRLSVTVNAGYKVCFPTMDEAGHQLFANDLGTGIADSYPINCSPDGSLNSAICVLHHGGSSLSRPACIIATGVNSLGSSSSPTLWLDKIYNPTDGGTDDRHIHIEVYAYNGNMDSDSMVIAQVLFDVYTLTIDNPAALTDTAPTLSEATNTAGTLITGLDLDGSGSCPWYILEFPMTISGSESMSGCSCSAHSKSGWVVCSSCGCGATVNVSVSATTFPYNPTDRVLKTYYIGTNAYGTKILKSVTTYGAFASLTAKTGNSARIVPQYDRGNTVPTNTVDYWLMAYELNFAIPAGGCLKVDLSVTPWIPYCSPSYIFTLATPSQPWTCSVTGAVLQLSGFTTSLPSSTDIGLITVLRLGVGTTVSVTGLTTWADSTCSQNVIEQDSSGTPYSVSGSGANSFTPAPAISPRQTVPINNKAEILFWMTPSVALSSSDSIEISMDLAVTIAGSLLCEIRTSRMFKTAKVAICWLDATNHVFTLKPASGLAVGTQVGIRIYTTGAAGGDNGVITSTSTLQNALTVKTIVSGSVKDMGVLYFRQPSLLFSRLAVTPLHITHNQSNILAFQMTLGATPIAATSSVILEFPALSLDGTKTYFADDLGTGQSSNTYQPACAWDAAYSGTGQTCLLVRGLGLKNIHPRIVFTGGSVAANGTFTLKVVVKNPLIGGTFNGDDYIMHFRAMVQTAAGALSYERYVFNVYALDNTSASASATLTAGSFNPSATTSFTVNVSSMPAGFSLSNLVISSADTFFDLSTYTLAGAESYFPNTNLLLRSASGSSESITMKAPPYTEAVSGIVISIIATRNGQGYRVGSATVSTPTGSTRTSSSGFNTKLESYTNIGSHWRDGLWVDVYVYVDADAVKRPAGYLLITLDSGFDYDPGTIGPYGFGADVGKVRWSASGQVITMWGFGEITNQRMGARVYMKGKDNRSATVKLCRDTSCTSTFGSDNTNNLNLQPSVSQLPLLSLSMNKKAGENSVSWSMSIQLGYKLKASANDYIHIQPYDMLNNGSDVTFNTCNLNVGGTAVGCSPGFWRTSGAGIYLMYPSSDVGTGLRLMQWTVSGGPRLPAAGYYIMLVYVRHPSPGDPDEWGLFNYFVPPVNFPTVSDFGPWIYKGNSIYEPKVTLSMGLAANSVIRFTFAAANYGNNLGFSPGASVPAAVTPAGTDCFVAQGGQGSTSQQGDAPVSIICVLGAAVASGVQQTFLFPFIRNPDTFTGSTQLEVLTYSFSSDGQSQTYYEYLSLSLALSTGTGTCSQVSSNTITGLPMGQNTAHAYSLTTNTNTNSANGYFLITFGSEFDLSAASGTGVSIYKTITSLVAPCPCLVVQYLSPALTMSISFTLTTLNPSKLGTFSTYVYPHLKSTSQCGNIAKVDYTTVVPAVAALSSLVFTRTVSNNSLFKQESGYFGVSFTPTSFIPSDGCIQLTFSGFSFVNANMAQVSGLSDYSSTDLVTLSTSGTTVSITKITAVSIGTTIGVTSFYAELPSTAFTFQVQTFATTACTNTINSSVSGSQVVVGAHTNFFTSTELLFNSPGIVTGFKSPGPSSRAYLVFYIDPSASLPASYSNGSSDGTISLEFSAAAFSLGADGDYFAVYMNPAGAQLLALGTSTSGNTVKIWAPAHTSITSGTVWRVILGNTNGSLDGLSMASSPTTPITIDSTTASYNAAVQFPLGPAFSSLSVRYLGANSAGTNGLVLTFKLVTTVSPNPEIVLEFPTLDDSLTAIFSADIGSGLSSAGKVPCGLYVNGSILSSVSCRLYRGATTSPFAFAHPARVLISRFGSLNANDEISLSLGQLGKTVDRVGDLVVYTRSVTPDSSPFSNSDVYRFKDYQYYEGAVQPQTSAISPVTLNSQTVADTRSGFYSNWSFDLKTTANPSDVDALTLVFNPNYYDTDFISASYGSTTSSNIYVEYNFPTFSTINPQIASIPSLGWVIMFFPSTLLMTVPLVLYLNNAKNMKYVPTGSEWVVTGLAYTYSSGSICNIANTWTMSTGGATVTLGNAISFTASTTPSQPLPAARNYFGTPSNLLYYGGTDLFYVQFISTRSFLSVTVDFTGWGAVGSCSVSNSLTCSWTGSVWKAVGSVASSVMVTVWGQVTSPAAAGVSTLTVTTYADAALAQGRDTVTSASLSFQPCCLLASPAQFSIPLQRDYNKVLSRPSSREPLTFIITPQSSLSGNGYVKFSPSPNGGNPYGIAFGSPPSSPTLLCKFILFSNQNLSYKARTCAESSGTYKVTNPLLAPISAGTKYIVYIYSSQYEDTSNSNGVSVPSMTGTDWTGNLDYSDDGTVDAMWVDHMLNTPTSAPSLTFTNTCRTANFQTNVLKVESNFSYGAYTSTTADRIAVIFPSEDSNSNSLFSQGLGNFSDGQSLGCSVATGLTGVTDCVLRHSYPVSWNARSPSVELVGQHASSATFTFYIPRITNPAVAERTVWLGLISYRYSGGTVELTDCTYLFNLWSTGLTSAPATNTKASYMTRMAIKVVGTGTTSTDIYTDATDGGSAVSVPVNGSIILVFPFALTSASSSTYIIAKCPSVSLMLLRNSSGAPVGGPLTLSGLPQVGYPAVTSALKAYCISPDPQAVFTDYLEYKQVGSSSPSPSPTPGATGSISLTSLTSAVAGTSLMLALNVREGFLVTFKTGYTYTSGALTLTFNGGFTMDHRCYWMEASIIPYTALNIACAASGATATVTNIGAWTGTSSLAVQVWGFPTASGAHSLTITGYSDDALSTQVETDTITGFTVGTAGTSSLQTVISPALRTEYIAVQRNSRAPLTFTVQLQNTLAAGGTLTLTWTPSMVSFNPSVGSETILVPFGTQAVPRLVCLWICSAVTYLSSTCQISGASLLVSAPQSTSIPDSVSCIVKVTSTMNKVAATVIDGVTLGNSSQSYFYITATTASDFSSDYIFLAPGLPSNYSVLPASCTVSSTTALRLSFALNQTLRAGLPVTYPTGGAEIIVQFDGAVMLPGLGDPVVSTADYSNHFGETDCYNIAGLSGVNCYLRRGTAANRPSPELWMRNFPALASGSTVDLLLAHMINPASLAQMQTVKVFMRQYNSATDVFEYLHFFEIRYLYMTESSVPSSSSGVTPYPGSVALQSTTTLTFSVYATSTLLPWTAANTNTPLIILSFLSVAPSDISPATYAGSHMWWKGIIHKAFVFLPTSNIVSGDSIVISNFPTPSYALAQDWQQDCFSQRRYSATRAYASFLPTAFTTSTSCAVQALLDPGIYPTHLMQRAQTYLLTFALTAQAPKGGSLVVQVPPVFTGLLAGCQVLDGLLWAACIQASASTYTVTGFSTYVPGGLWVVLAVTVIAPAPSTGSFSVNSYQVAGNPLTLVQSLSCPSVSVAAQQSAFLSVAVSRWLHHQSPACCSQAAPLSFAITPRSLYSYLYSIQIRVPAGTTSPASGVLECTISNGFNTVPSEGCSFSAMLVRVYVPEQLPMQAGTAYVLTLRYRDSGSTVASLNTDGFTLPPVADVLNLSNGSVHFFLSVIDTSGGLVEAAKIRGQACSLSLTTYSVTSAHNNVGKYSFFDLVFQPVQSIPAASTLTLAFSTHNELTTLFLANLGLTTSSVPCNFLSGFTNALSLSCSLVQPSSIGAPSLVHITGHGGFAANSSNRLRIAKVKNPDKQVDPIFSRGLLGHFYFSISYDSFPLKLAEGWDYRVFNADLNLIQPTSRNGLVSISGPNTVSALLAGADYLQFTFSDPGTTQQGVTGGFVVFLLDPAFLLPSSALTCAVPTSSCLVLAFPTINWVTMSVNGATVTAGSGLAVRLFGLNAPAYVRANYSLHTWVFSSAAAGKIWTDDFEATLASVTASALTGLSVTRSSPMLPLNTYTYDLYTVTVTPATGSVLVKRIDVVFPAEFQWVAKECESYGNVKENPSNAVGVSCVSDCSTEWCSKTVSLTNFQIINPAANYQITIGALNPKTAGLTSAFRVYFYASAIDVTQVIEQRTNQGALTFLSPAYPFDVWVEWVRVSQADRYIRAGQYGEIVLRMESRVVLPSATGQISLELPVGFDIAHRRTPLCIIGYGSNPFSQFPLLWGEKYTHTVGDCSWSSSRVITVRFPSTVLREWYGLSSQCTYLVLTTSGLRSAQEGFLAPPVPGWYKVPVYSGTNPYQTLETSFPLLYVAPAVLSTLTIVSSIRESNTEALLRITFTAPTTIPKGYSLGQMDSWGTVDVSFETYEGFAADLGEGYVTGGQVPCFAYSGLLARTGGQVSCTFTAGDLSLTTPSPAVVRLSNFEAVAAGTSVQLHFPKVKYPGTLGYVPKVSVGAYSTAPNLQVSWIFTPTQVALPAVTALTATNLGGLAASVIPNSAGLSTILKLPFQVSSSLSAGDLFIINFPVQYSYFPPSASLSAAIKDASTGVTIQGGLQLVVYSTARIVMVMLNAGFGLFTGHYLEIQRLRNPEYASSCALTWSVSHNGVLAYTFSSPAFAVAAAGIINSQFSLSSYQASAVNVQLTAQLTQQARLPIGSTILITLPSAFPPMTNSSPLPTCSMSLPQATCTITSSSALISGFSEQTADTPATFTLTGLRNPSVSGPVSGVTVLTKNSSGQTLVSAQLPQVLQLTESASVQTLSLSIEPALLSLGVTTRYHVVLVTGVLVPAGGSLLITLPGFQLSSAVDCAATSLASYSFCGSTSLTTLKVSLDQALAGNVTVSLDFEGVKTPVVGGSPPYALGPVQGSAMYDSVVLSESVPTFIRVLSQVPAGLIARAVSFSPGNEAEYACYNFTLQLSPLTGKRLAVLLQFPLEFSKVLVPSDLQPYCSSLPVSTSCQIQESRRVVFSGFNGTTFSNFTLQVFGVVNPRVGVTGPMAIYVEDMASRVVLAYNETVISFNIANPPAVLFLRKVTPSDFSAGALADYSVAFDTGALSAQTNTALWLDWPDAYRGLFTDFTLNCTSNVLNAQPICALLPQTGQKRVEILGLGSLSRNTLNISLTLLRVPNPRAPILARPYEVRIADLATQLVLSKNYNSSHLAVPVKGASLMLDTPTQATVIRGTFSKPFAVKLGESSYSLLTVTPLTQQAGFVFKPTTLNFQFAWNASATFQVGAPLLIPAGKYVMSFTKTEAGSQRYSSLSEVTLQVLDPVASLRVEVDPIPLLHVSQLSPPIQVRLALAAVDGLHVFLMTSSPSQPSLVHIQPQELEFGSAEEEHNFTITALQGATAGYISLRLFGPSASAYSLQTTLIPFSVTGKPAEYPSVLHLRVHTSERTKAVLRVTLNTPCQVCYIFAFKGTLQPTAQQVVQTQVLANDSPQASGCVYTNSSQYIADISTNTLTDDMQYVVFVVGRDSLGRVSEVTSLELRTAASFRPVSFRVGTSQPVPTSTVIHAVAMTLGLPDSLLRSLRTPSSRNLQEVTGPVLYELSLAMSRSQEARAPLYYLQHLNMQTLQSYLPEVLMNESVASSATEFEYARSEWTQFPQVLNISNSSASVFAATSPAGTLYGIALPKTQPQPLAQQIALGLDSFNVKASHWSSQPCDYKTPTELSFSNLTRGMQYMVWLVSENDLPGVPALMKDEQVVGVEFTAGVSLDKDVLVTMEDDIAVALELALVLLAL